MKYNSLIIPVIVVFASVGCRKIIEPKDLPQQDPRLVLNSIMYPDSLISADVSLSKSILTSKEYKYISDAACELYENGTYIETLAPTGNGKYTSKIKAKSNTTYNIKVTASGYTGVSGEDHIPANMAFTPIERVDTVNIFYAVNTYTYGQTLSRDIGGSARFKFRIIDDINVKNYYNIRPVVYVVDRNTNDSVEVFSVGLSNNLESANNQAFISSGQAIGLTDEQLTNGKEIQVDLTLNFHWQFRDGFDLSKVVIAFELYNASTTYYRYISTLNDQFYGGTNPFAEPVQVYSNVSNGMGIVAGSNISTVIVEQKSF